MVFKMSEFGLGFKRSDFDRDRIITIQLLRKDIAVKLLSKNLGGGT